MQIRDKRDHVFLGGGGHVDQEIPFRNVDHLRASSTNLNSVVLSVQGDFCNDDDDDDEVGIGCAGTVSAARRIYLPTWRDVTRAVRNYFNGARAGIQRRRRGGGGSGVGSRVGGVAGAGALIGGRSRRGEGAVGVGVVGGSGNSAGVTRLSSAENRECLVEIKQVPHPLCNTLKGELSPFTNPRQRPMIHDTIEPVPLSN